MKPKKLESLTSQCGFKLAISDSTHILEISSSCTDLIFMSQSNLFMNLSVNSLVNPNCHHQVIHAKFKLKIFHPSPYEQDVSHYQDANNYLIQRSMSQFSFFSQGCK